jgi:ureidoglycolate lyase
MRLITFRTDSGSRAVGVLFGDGDRILDLSHPSCTTLLEKLPHSLLAMIEDGLSGWTTKIARLIAAENFHPAAILNLSELKLDAPIPNPGKVVGAAYNFTDALDERAMPYPQEPVIFIRSGNTVIGPKDTILVPPDVGNVGYEAELAVVIGKQALFIEPDNAMAYVAGYTVHNDISGSGMIKEDQGNFVRGKNMPASAPFGPYLITPDEISNPYAIDIMLDIDGRQLQKGSTATMLFKIAELISYISKQMPLEPGDIIATGTPAGLAMMHTPTAWLQVGQTVNVELKGLGCLSNPIKQGAPFLE